ncbi:hypothetical protein AAKU67_003588 [Oxalobacteraceae bacterium GrIS 2.11]
MNLTQKYYLCCALFIALAQPSLAADHPNNSYQTNLPPSAQLHYSIKADRSGLTLTGEATVSWQQTAANNSYAISTETHAAIFGKILQADSHGTIDAFGLAPELYEERPRNKSATQTHFNRESKQITFSESADTYPILGGEQDRNSIVWQLVSMARAAPKKFLPKSEWNFFVAGRHDAERWTFTVSENVTMATAMGNIATVHIVKAPPPDSKDQRLDIWLAPSLEWYPVRLKFSDANGDTIDQRLDQIKNNP